MRLASPFMRSAEHILVELSGASALFTTRRGGVSSGPYESLNLGRLTGDRAEAVARNRQLVAEQVGLPLVGIRQVHSSHVRQLGDHALERGVEEADGQATRVRGVAPMVLVADCLPVVIAGGGAVAVLHAGWRGLAAGIVQSGVQALRSLGAGGELEAAIGPGAGPCCYEVGEEVHARFAADGAAARHGDNLDLKAIARLRLRESGVEHVHDVGLCTICGEESLFFSHRRDGGITGRQAGIAWLN